MTTGEDARELSLKTHLVRKTAISVQIVRLMCLGRRPSRNHAGYFSISFPL